MKHRILLFLSILGISSVGFAQSAADTVASVNGETILRKDYIRKMEYLPGVGKKVGANWIEVFPGLLTLDTIITEKLLAQLAKQKGVFPSDVAVQQEKAKRIGEYPALIEDWKGSGRTEAELDANIRADLIYYNLVTYGIVITDSQVKDFYTKNPANFTSPKMVALSVIAVSDSAAGDAVDKALASGRTFADVAKEMSLDVSKASGGELALQEFEGLSEITRNAISAIKVGQTTGWINSDSGIRIKFFLRAVQKEKLLPYTDDLARGIRNRLMLQRGQVKNDVRKELLQMRQKATIVIGDPAFSEAYARFIADYLKANAGAKS